MPNKPLKGVIFARCKKLSMSITKAELELEERAEGKSLYSKTIFKTPQKESIGNDTPYRIM